MTKHNMTQTTLGRTALRVLGTFLGRPFEHLLALVHEWQARRHIAITDIERGVYHARGYKSGIANVQDTFLSVYPLLDFASNDEYHLLLIGMTVKTVAFSMSDCGIDHSELLGSR